MNETHYTKAGHLKNEIEMMEAMMNSYYDQAAAQRDLEAKREELAKLLAPKRSWWQIWK